jgi:hypothetical protein
VAKNDRDACLMRFKSDSCLIDKEAAGPCFENV